MNAIVEHMLHQLFSMYQVRPMVQPVIFPVLCCTQCTCGEVSRLKWNDMEHLEVSKLHGKNCDRTNLSEYKWLIISSFIFIVLGATCTCTSTVHVYAVDREIFTILKFFTHTIICFIIIKEIFAIRIVTKNIFRTSQIERKYFYKKIIMQVLGSK